MTRTGPGPRTRVRGGRLTGARAVHSVVAIDGPPLRPSDVRRMGPEQGLLSALVEDAARWLRRSRVTSAAYAEAYLWFADVARIDFGSFRFACDQLGMDADYLRGRLLATAPAPGPGALARLETERLRESRAADLERARWRRHQQYRRWDRYVSPAAAC